MSCKRLYITEFHCHKGKHKEIYTYRLYHRSSNSSSHFAFYYFTLYDMISVAAMVFTDAY